MVCFVPWSVPRPARVSSEVAGGVKTVLIAWPLRVLLAVTHFITQRASTCFAVTRFALIRGRLRFENSDLEAVIQRSFEIVSGAASVAPRPARQYLESIRRGFGGRGRSV